MLENNKHKHQIETKLVFLDLSRGKSSFTYIMSIV